MNNIKENNNNLKEDNKSINKQYILQIYLYFFV